uniref:histidine kinase n=1 Tax=Candidatus Kentrum sp. FW TaxID=2126338 RepID=A0A450U4A8_9GAMM|nr:MAG: nitrogen fixation negative regulator NifL [Candidatus Kentron sp. FW]
MNQRKTLAPDVAMPAGLSADTPLKRRVPDKSHVAELHRLEQLLKLQKGLGMAIDSAPMVVAIIGIDGSVLFDNRAYKALRCDLCGQEPAGAFLAAIEQQTGFTVDKDLHRGRGFTNIDVRLNAADGALLRWFVCSGVYVEGAGKAEQRALRDELCCYLLLMANEVTASYQRIDEARLNLIRIGITEQQVLQTMREAISAAIFKLQAPLNVARAALAMQGSMDDHPNGMHKEVLREVLQSGDEALESLHTALPCSLGERISPINVNEVLHEVLKLSTDRLLAAGIVIEWRPATVLPTVNGRINTLRCLFNHLVDNAIHAMNESGKDHRELHLTTRQDGGELAVEIMDNGHGIPDPNRLKVFEPFFCGWSQPFGHAGMGLTLAREAALDHGGIVEISDGIGGGCRVTVGLPLRGMEGE